MELETRQMTFEEMYFKKPITLHLPAATSQDPTNTGFLSGGQTPNAIPIPVTPTMDLANKVFPTPTFWERTGTFLEKNWVWVLLGAGVAAVVGKVLYDKHQKNKKKGSEQVAPNNQPQHVYSETQPLQTYFPDRRQQGYANNQPQQPYHNDQSQETYPNSQSEGLYTTSQSEQKDSNGQPQEIYINSQSQ